VIENLLVNAAQYTEGGGHITLLMERRGDTALIRVRDDGIGITSVMLPRIFDMFTQAEQRGDGPRRGLGSGLPLPQRLVEMHGGAIAVKSAGEGCGSEFTVSLPLITARSARSDRSEAMRDDAPAGAARPLPILAGAAAQSATHGNGGGSHGAKG